MTSFEKIMKFLFHNQVAWYVDMFGKIKSNKTTLYLDRNNCTSLDHIEKWLCINDLINIAKYFNKNCELDHCTADSRYYIQINSDGEPKVNAAINNYSSFIYFNKYDDAIEAIGIIGKEKLNKIFKY